MVATIYPRVYIAAAVALLLAAACTAGPLAASALGPTPPAPSPATEFLAIPPDLRFPRVGVPSSVVQPESTPAVMAAGEHPLDLGHCGLSSPIDFDGSLWEPIAMANEAGGALTEAQQSDLINSAVGVASFPDRLTDPNRAILRTQSGLLLLLARWFGPIAYPLCD